MTPKQGRDGGGLDAVRKLHLVLFCTLLVGAGTLMRLLDLAGVGPLPDLPGIAAVVVPAARALIELRRLLATTCAVGRRRQRRLVYRFEGDAPADCYSADGHIPRPPGRRQRRRRSAWSPSAPLEVGERPAVLLELTDAAGVEPRGRRPDRGPHLPRVEGSFLVGATILDIDPEARMRLMEWCYVVCSHERLRGHRPAGAAARVRGDRRLPRRLPRSGADHRGAADSRSRPGLKRYCFLIDGAVF